MLRLADTSFIKFKFLKPYNGLFILFILFIYVFIGSILSACLRTNSDIQEIKEKQILKEQLSNIQKSTVTQDVRFQDIQEAFQNLTNRVEILEGQHRKDQELRKQDLESYNKRIEDIEKKSAALTESFNKSEEEVHRLSKVLDSGELVQHKSENKKKESEAEVLKVAEDLIKQKKWKNAALAYKKYREDFPKGVHLIEATYKIGLCFQELGDKDAAEAFYREVVAKKDKSKYSKKAAYRLKNLHKK